jgi:tripartite-type tricarboxylate transporter receptor subunit TctC
MYKFLMVAIVVAVAVAFAAAALAAEQYPARALDVVVTFPPGGSVDVATRIVAPKLSAQLGVPVVVNNKVGGGGAIGTDFVAKATADGYTVLATANPSLTILPITQPNLGYKTDQFTPIGSFAVDVSAVVVRADSPWRTVEELVEHARRNPGKLSYGSAGPGTVSFFTMELVKLARGLDIVHVPFAGTPPVKNAVLGGHVDVASGAFGVFASVIRSGHVRALITSAARRIPNFPDVPTMAEKGLSDAALSIWTGLYVPAATPAPVVARLEAALRNVMKDSGVIEAVEKAGMIAEYRGGDDVRSRLEGERRKIAEAAKRLNVGR